MVFCSTHPILSMNTTVNSFERILSLCLHYWESCCLLNQIQSRRRKGRIITVSSPHYFSPGLRNEHRNHLTNPGNSSLRPVKMTCLLIFNELFYNLTLLHKSKEETHIHLMQMRIQEQSPDSDADDFDDTSS